MATVDYSAAIENGIKVYKAGEFMGYYVSHQKPKINRHEYIEVKTVDREKTYFYIRHITISARAEVEKFPGLIEEAQTTKELIIP